MSEIIILAIALSMDAFAVAIGLGTKGSQYRLPLKAALFFGGFQTLMPAIGYLAGNSLLHWIGDYATWIASGLLILIGLKMLHESTQEGVENELQTLSYRMLLMLAIATSIDAMAAGFSLNVLDTSPYLACGLIGIVTALMSYLGVHIGARTGTWLESKAEILGGVVLILIGLKIILI